jgi:hypothetical protein
MTACRATGTPSLRCALVAAPLFMILTLRPMADGPPPGRTGGFGEPTCRECHADNPLNDAGGRLTLSGLERSYRPGATYRVEVTLERRALARAGFQLAARLADGAGRGRQAGSLRAAAPGVQVIRDTTGIAYAEHTRLGTDVSHRGRARWVVEWTAPEQGGSVVFHVVANAANDDDSEFGDFIYVIERRIGSAP